ncbi:hypothetical protein [Sphingomonas sp. BK235]|uniref:hypothetical protein n=1 Tax=Sphingomonas sp. BK235 TaxID=2512131 RepID=UPI00104E89B1|nr:hypothetical protein [Sphingomonas sp. BK235]TCP34345.1 hypothetical protein EV292_104337 [Sphingomonas sp. BK235]
MNAIDGYASFPATPLHGAGAIAPAPAGTHADARSLAGTAIGEIGQRVLAWVGQSARSHDTASHAWQASSGVAGSFRPDPAELARGGDVYDLRGLAADLGAHTGATPTQEGELRRALEDVTRGAAIQLAGLSGAPADRQLAGMREALAGALEIGAGEGADGVVARLQAAAATLARGLDG